MNFNRALARCTLFRFHCKNFTSVLHFFNKDDEALKISQACVYRLKKIASDGMHLRVTVDGGGCSGFQYRFDLDSKINEDDELFEKDGVKVVVDKISVPFLKGSTVDYHEELIRSAFRIINNPQADSRCSCGSSFAVKLN